MGMYYLILIVFGIVSSIVSSTLKRKFKKYSKGLFTQRFIGQRDCRANVV